MKALSIVSLVLAAVVGGLLSPAAPAAEQAEKSAKSAAETIKRFHELSATTTFCTPSFWAWQLQLAIVKKDRALARGLAEAIYGLQKPDGRWGLGTDWTRGEWDFKDRLAEDAESWEVAEVANALLDYAQAFDDPTAAEHAAKAAEYLKNRVEYCEGKPYLAHMPECNHVLQPHSTVNAALALSRVKGYEKLAQALKEAGVAMNFRRIITHRGQEKLAPALAGAEINDYEKIQIGYYLLQMEDPLGREILNRYKGMEEIAVYRGAAYLVLAYARLGEWEKAKRFALLQKDLNPRRGYEHALKDFIDYTLRRDEAKR